ncbi:uncharacterized protein METZ01_LOCUS357068, partial [marine metagenome]
VLGLLIRRWLVSALFIQIFLRILSTYLPEILLTHSLPDFQYPLFNVVFINIGIVTTSALIPKDVIFAYGADYILAISIYTGFLSHSNYLW